MFPKVSKTGQNQHSHRVKTNIKTIWKCLLGLAVTQRVKKAAWVEVYYLFETSLFRPNLGNYAQIGFFTHQHCLTVELFFYLRVGGMAG